MGRGTNWTIRGKLNFVVDIVLVYVGVLVVQGNQAVVGVEVVSHVSVVVVFVVVQVVALFVAAVFVVVVVVVVVPCELLKLLDHMSSGIRQSRPFFTPLNNGSIVLLFY